MKLVIAGPLFNPEHKKYKMNSYNEYKCEFCEFNCDSPQTDLSNHYAWKLFQLQPQMIQSTTNTAQFNIPDLYTVSLNNTNVENYWLFSTNAIVSYY